MTIPKELKHAINNKNLVIFAGSGLSSKFSLPSWKNLTIDVINSLENDKFNKLKDVLEQELFSPIEILDKLEEEHYQVRKYVKDNFKLDSSQNFSLHKKILKLTDSIVTTNFDNAFELASNNNIQPTIHTSSFNVSELVKSKDPFIFKIHGCYSEPDNCIIFSSDYKDIYNENSAIKEKLKTLFLNKTILFIGFSFSDPQINEIFNSLDQTFDNNNRHFILTRESSEFEKFHFLKSIPIVNYDIDVDSFIDNCLQIKEEESPEKITQSNKTDHIPKIAFLKPNPLDIKLSSDLNRIEKCLDELDVILHHGFLNESTLESIDDYDILVIGTQVFKKKLYIEEDNLMSNLQTANEVSSLIPNENIPIIFITDEKVQLTDNFETINISTFKRATIKRFIFKALRNRDLNFSQNEPISISISELIYPEIKKGKARKTSIYSNERVLDIGVKSLKNIIGRIEEQAAIASKLINIRGSSKILNIKASGGTGKTTLIKKVSYELYNRGYYKEGVSFKSCENVKNYDDFEEILFDAFNLRNILDFKEYLVENYYSNKLDSLIILDNFETISNELNKDEFEKVISLLKFSSDFTDIVITSRERISKLEDYEDLYSLAPLNTDDALALFKSEYGEVKDDYEISILRHEILEELLNNNPLAIKLVTKSRTRSKHITELRDQIKEHFFESLNDDYTTVFKNKADLNIERTKSIYQSINYSYTTLKNKERIAFELLHLFPDGISLSNFKKCFTNSNSTNNISDKHLRILRDKSLVEDYNGTLQLQPIIRRFAESKFSQREIETKQKYYLDAYIFNSHLLEIIDLIDRKKSTSEALKVYTNYKNNLLNVFDYIPNIKIHKDDAVPEKKYLLNYIYGLEDYIVNEKQIKEFYDKLNNIESYFSDISYAEILINVIKLCKKYYFKEFDTSYNELEKIFPPSEMNNRDFAKEDHIENLYKNIISSIHNMEGHTLRRIKSLVDNDNFSLYLDVSFFYLGIPSVISRKKVGFYHFEFDLMYNEVNIRQLEDYISSLYSEEHLEIMQSTYTLSKCKTLNIKTINKLVVTNPYTRGLKNLMYAFVSSSREKQKMYFQEALKNLSHIKYYYLEALFFYCKFLKKVEQKEYIEFAKEGLDLSKKYYYQYLHHQFENFLSNENNMYEFSYSFYPIENLNKYVEKHNNQWEKIFKENDDDF